MDGILQAFAVVSSVSGGGLDPKTVIYLGIATSLADALSMGLGDYSGSKAEMDFAKEQKKREKWYFILFAVVYIFLFAAN